jgi:uncharacterized protein (DUF433 family)
MPTKTSARTQTTTRTLADSAVLSRREAAFFAGVSLKAVDKAIEERIVRSRRGGGLGTVLGWDDVVAIAAIGKAQLPLQVKTKKQIRRWVGDSRPYFFDTEPELQLSEAMVLRLDPWFRPFVNHLERYLRSRERYIESSPEIQGGEPVIKGTRLPVRSVAERLKRGDSLDELVEDYPRIPKTAFEAAWIYAQSHPRRGRPARPWRDA